MSLPKPSNTPIKKALENLTIPRQDNIQDPRALRLSPSGKIVVLNGLPGTGKLTILKHLKELISEFATCLLDNHLLIDPVTAVIPNRTDRHHELRRLVRGPIFEELSNQARKGHTILMTACLAAGVPIDEAFYQEHLDISRRSDTPIYWINVECRRDIHEQRVSTPERQQDSKAKLTDIHILRLIMDAHKLIEPDFISRGDSSVELAFGKLDLSSSSLQKIQLLLLLTRNLLPLPLNRPVDLSLAHTLISVHKQLLLLLASLQVERRLALRHKLLLLLAMLLQQVLLLLSAQVGLLARLHGLKLALEILLFIEIFRLLDLNAQVSHFLIAILIQKGIGFAGFLFVHAAD
ncbi:hypothetical protein HG530_002896 [Fusarium avenaceum]|nr:hypothetical protein HG530_002896 [Fusarium avenaceum]